MGFLALALMVFAFELAQLVKTEGASKLITKGERAGFILLWVATGVLGTGVVLRGIAANRVPWANMYEFAISTAFLVLLIYITAMSIKDLKFIATFISGFALVTLFAAVSLFYVEVKTLMPALQSYWLVIHVVVAVLATGFFTISAGLHISYLVKAGNLAKNR